VELFVFPFVPVPTLFRTGVSLDGPLEHDRRPADEVALSLLAPPMGDVKLRSGSRADHANAELNGSGTTRFKQRADHLDLPRPAHARSWLCCRTGAATL
jgi:hypothetical protein